jgi:hypothetical protein
MADAAEHPIQEPTDAQQFFNVLHSFIDALSETFDDSPTIKKKAKSLAMFADQPLAWATAITEWRTNLTEENKVLLSNKDPRIFVEMFDKHPLLDDIKFSEKWLDPTLTDDSRDTVWWYMQELSEKAFPTLKKEPVKKRKNMKKKKNASKKSDSAETIARRFCKKHNIDINEETGDVRFNYKKLMDSNPLSDPDVMAMREYVGI